MTRGQSIRFLSLLLILGLPATRDSAHAIERSELNEETQRLWDSFASLGFSIGDQATFKSQLVAKPAPTPPPRCTEQRREFVSGYYHAATGTGIPEILMHCEDPGSLACVQYRNRDNAVESEQARDRRLRQLACCKAGVFKGMADVYQVMLRESPRVCLANYADGQTIGEGVCTRAQVCYNFSAVHPTCMQLGFLMAKAECDSTFRTFIERHGISISNRDEDTESGGGSFHPRPRPSARSAR